MDSFSGAMIDNSRNPIYLFARTQREDLRTMAKAPVSIEDLDFEQLDDQQLRVAIQRISETLQTRFTTKTQEFRELAREMGFTVTLSKIGKEETRRGRREGQGEDRRRIVAQKYRNPDNYAQTWSGRGREPQWYKDKIASGASAESMLISSKGQGSPQGARGETKG